MTNHPNRSRRYDAPGRNPTPDEIRELRDTAGLTQRDAARLIHCTERGWQDWEGGARKMHPAFWELFRLKLKIIDGPAAVYTEAAGPSKMRARLVGCPELTKDERHSLEAEYSQKLVALFGTIPALVSAKSGYDDLINDRGTYPCGEAYADDIMGRWLQACSEAARFAARRHPGISIPEAARYEIGFR